MAIVNVAFNNLVQMMNEIQDLCLRTGTDLNIDLPQIAVIGAESVGKSSVLESFVGRQVIMELFFMNISAMCFVSKKGMIC